MMKQSMTLSRTRSTTRSNPRSIDRSGENVTLHPIDSNAFHEMSEAIRIVILRSIDELFTPTQESRASFYDDT